jgi:signal transduction histidine kinase/DNA-binding response OmpR family regulator
MVQAAVDAGALDLTVASSDGNRYRSICKSNAMTASSKFATLRRIQIATALVAACITAVGLTGLIFGISGLVKWAPVTASMVPNTACCILALCIGLVANAFGRFRMAQVLGYGVVVVVVVVLSQYVTGRDYGIDRLLISAPQGLVSRTSPNAGTALILAGLAMGALNSGRWLRVLAPLLASGALAVGLMSLLGYVTGLSPAYQWGNLSGMSIPTMSAMLCLSAGLFAAIRARSRDFDFVLPLVAAGIFILASVSISTVATASSFVDEQAWVSHTFQVRELLHRIQLDLDQAGQMERFHYNDGAETHVSQFDAKVREIAAERPRLPELVKDNPQQYQRALKLGGMVSGQIQRLQALFDLGVQGQVDPSIRKREVLLSMENSNAISRAIDGMLADEAGLLNRRTRAVEALSKEARRMTWLAGGVAFIALGAAIMMMLRVKRARDEAVIKLEQANRQLGAANLQLETDIEERKALQASLAEARDAAVEGSRLKSEFLANMSHELRTPMNGIIGMTELMLQSNMSLDQREMGNVVLQSADALLEIINDILDFSKIEAGRMHIDRDPFNVRQVVEDCMVLLAPRAHQKGIELVCDCDARLPDWLVGDGGRIRQVLMNLAGNAIKFTSEGEVVVCLEQVLSRGTHVTIRITVTDTGEGISEEALGRLFQPFTQADASTTRRFGGTGLGLAISRQLVELMDGRIEVRSVEGQGSRFWFDLELPVAADQTVTGIEAQDLSGRKILVVDDNENNRKVICGQLTALGANVDAVANAEDALSAFRARSPYAAVLLDWYMPECDGLCLARRLREGSSSLPPMVLMSSSAVHVCDGSEEMFDAVLVKPLRKSQLQRCLLRLIDPVGAETASMAGADKVPNDKSPGLNLLLVEDNHSNQLVVRMQLRRLGHNVDLADNGKSALEALSAQRYDGVFMDCQMPVLDGYEATQRIRSGGVPGIDPKIPIIALTANALPSDRLKCLMAGMDDFVTKPVRGEDLRLAIERCGIRSGYRN